MSIDVDGKDVLEFECLCEVLHAYIVELRLVNRQLRSIDDKLSHIIDDDTRGVRVEAG